MTGRERIATTLNHREPDRIALDFGGCAQTTIHVSVIAALRTYYGLEKRPVKVEEPYTMMGQMDEDLKSAIGVDVDAIPSLYSFFGVPRDTWKEYRMEDGLEVLIPAGFNTTRDSEGNIYAYPQGDTTAAPSGKMPRGGYYFDAIIRQEPINEDTLSVSDNLEEFKLISDAEVAWLQERVEECSATGRAALAAAPGAGLGDIACVPAPWLKHPRGIRDIQEWYISTLLRPDFLHELFQRQTDIAIGNLERIYAALGNSLDVIWVCGTDFGTQNSTFCSLETFHELYKPYYRRLNDWIHDNTAWKSFKHCCGAVEGFMEAFIASGFDIINPVQWTADGMDPGLLKQRYGSRITFWGGGVNTQQTLPFGTPGQVREEVLRSCEQFSPGGGFVFNAIHNIQAGTPVANVVAMLDAVREFSNG